MSSRKHGREPGRQSSQAQSRQSQSGSQSQSGQSAPAGNQMERSQSGQLRQGTSLPSIYSSSEPMRTSPFALMRRFAEEMDRMFEDFSFGGRLASQSQAQGLFAPQIEVFEREGELVVRADLPGVNKDDVHVEVTNEGILLEGERRYEHEESEGGIYRSERSYGTFKRMIPLPEGAQADEATATFKDGVLEIRMPAPEQQTRRRQIEISDESSGGRRHERAQSTSAGKR